MLPATTVGASSEIADVRLRRLYDYWATKRGGRPAPARGDIDPVEIPEVLGYVNIFDVQNDPREYRVRLNGSNIAEMLGKDITGQYCSTITSGEDAARCKKAFDICADRCIPVMVETTLAFCGKPYMVQTFILLPLSGDSEQVDMIVTAHSFHAGGSAPRQIDHPPRRADGR